MPGAIYHHGDPLMVDYTPGAVVTAGDVIVTGDTPRISHQDIPANMLGALAAGGGAYRVTADGAIPADRWVYWDAAAGKVTLTAGANKRFGKTVGAALANNDIIAVEHQPTPT